ncbi:aldo/keto reductase [Dactylosporangium roseum]|uniref:Aldo/keto reductase n=1 Tax=Dactylosporangium roseum TaxID=47989 RepID=A0ABY5Z151_9ACTN|nr:aldo/keto reductase [Dactylosporangium roseum]UWZ34813.1 aldo/keto reductase [Dactylosporangium roseum]
MRYNALGTTGLKVSAVSFGTAPLGDMFGKVDEAAAARVVGAAIDHGINLFDTAAYYGGGLAETRLGAAIGARRDSVLIATKAGRYGPTDFDYSPRRIRESLHDSLRRLRTDHVDIFQLHDIEFADLDRLFGEAYPELIRLRDAGKCRLIGMTGYPLRTMRRAVTETELDVVLSYAHFTLLSMRLTGELLPTCAERGTAVLNAAAVALGLLTPKGIRIDHLASAPIRAAAKRAADHCAERGADISFLANQFSIQRSGCPTTVVGTADLAHLTSAVEAADAEIDEDLLSAVIELTSDVHTLSWASGRPENGDAGGRASS